MFTSNLSPHDIREQQLSGWSHKVCDVPYRLSALEVDTITHYIRRYLAYYPNMRTFGLEKTWVMNRLGIPCLWLRLDIVPTQDGLVVFEIEDRSSGMGEAPLLNPQMGAILDQVSSAWPKFASIQSVQHSGSDDSLRWPVMSLDDYLALGSTDLLVLPRCEPHELAFHVLADRSIGPVRSEGDKSYGRGLGLWDEVVDADDINYALPWAIKRVQSSKMQGVKLYVPGRSKDRPRGCVSVTQARSFAEECINNDGAVYIQPLTEPPQCALGRFMLRPFVLFDMNRNEWVLAGGEWLAMDNYRLHGTSATVFGPLVLPEGYEQGVYFGSRIN